MLRIHYTLSTILSFLVLGCGPAYKSASDSPTESDPRIVPYLDKIGDLISEELGFAYHIKSPAVIKDLDNIAPGVIGYCTYYDNSDYNYISIDSDNFEYFTSSSEMEEDLLLILLHEIGHCDLGIQHLHEAITTLRRREFRPRSYEDPSSDFAYIWKLSPKGIMWPTISSETKTLETMSYYIRELFDLTEYPKDLSRVFEFEEQDILNGAQPKKFYQLFREGELLTETLDAKKFLKQFYSLTQQSNDSNNTIYNCSFAR